MFSLKRPTTPTNTVRRVVQSTAKAIPDVAAKPTDSAYPQQKQAEKVAAGSTDKSEPVIVQVTDGNRNFGKYIFQRKRIETTSALASILFNKIINDDVKLGPHLYSRFAIAKINSTDKSCILFVDDTKTTADDVEAVVILLANQGYTLPPTGAQGYFVASGLVLALSQGHLTTANLSAERDIAKDPTKNALMNSFTDIITWAYIQNADDIDFAVNVTSSKSQIAFKIGGRYVRPERHLYPTETVMQMLGIAWQKSQGGAASQFEFKTEQQAQVTLDLPPVEGMNSSVRVRLRWSGLPNDKGTCVTMRLQRLGESSRIRSLEEAGYLQPQIEILKRVIHSEGGMTTFSGVVGSGKTTSLIQLLSMLPRDIKIQSFEDPVELDLPFAYQRTITRDLAASGPDPSFMAAVRALYRSAMDVLYLGEIRDAETGLVARSVAESGHSVYTTTHARSALGIVDRFASQAVGIPRDVLATPDILKLLVFQALLPKTCPHCGKSPDDYAHAFSIKGDALGQHKKYFDRLYDLYGIDPGQFRMRDERGCEHCIKPELFELNGLNGRTVVCEMVEPDEQMLSYIVDTKNIELINYWRSLASRSYEDENLIGKTTMECAIYKASQGIVDPREIEPRFMRFETVEAKRKNSERYSQSKQH
jgi:general secretion pathway protein E